MSHLGESLKARRKAKGLSQLEVAAAVGVSQRAYSLWEEGKRNPKMASIIRLNEVLGPEQKSTIVLFEGEAEKKALEQLTKKLELGNINVTVADYINLQSEHKKAQERLIEALLREKEINSTKMDFYADEVLKNMRVDHDKIMDALDQLRGERPGTLAREADSIATGVRSVKKGKDNRKSVSGKRDKT